MNVSDVQDPTPSHEPAPRGAGRPDSAAGSPAPQDPHRRPPGREDEPMAEPQSRSLPRSPDDLMDELLGDDLDWERLVRTYPTPAVALALAGGAWLGYRHGQAIFAAVTGYLASEAARRVNEFLGEDAL